jgi:hypothetical protein
MGSPFKTDHRGTGHVREMTSVIEAAIGLDALTATLCEFAPLAGMSLFPGQAQGQSLPASRV